MVSARSMFSPLDAYLVLRKKRVADAGQEHHAHKDRNDSTAARHDGRLRQEVEFEEEMHRTDAVTDQQKQRSRWTALVTTGLVGS
jgi:hypothetical protein